MVVLAILGRSFANQEVILLPLMIDIRQSLIFLSFTIQCLSRQVLNLHEIRY